MHFHGQVVVELVVHESMKSWLADNDGVLFCELSFDVVSPLRLVQVGSKGRCVCLVGQYRHRGRESPC